MNIWKQALRVLGSPTRNLETSTLPGGQQVTQPRERMVESRIRPIAIEQAGEKPTRAWLYRDTLFQVPSEIDSSELAAEYIRHRIERAKDEIRHGGPEPPAESNPEGLTLAEFIGQEEIREELRDVFAESFRRTGRWSAPLCFRGPTGTGKTALARALARELAVKFHEFPAPRLSKERFLCRIRELSQSAPPQMVFLDDLHALEETPEFLFAALDNPGKVIFLAAATRALKDPQLRRRFIELPLKPYTEQELADCARVWAGRLGIRTEEEALSAIARSYARGCPGRTVILIRRAAAHVQAGKAPAVDLELVSTLLARAGVIPGTDLDERDIRILGHLREAEGAVGKQSLSEHCGEDPETYEFEREPYLLSRGYLTVVRGQGRRIAARGLRLLDRLVEPESETTMR